MKSKIIKGIITILFIIALFYLLRTIDFSLVTKEFKNSNKIFIILAIIGTLLAVLIRIIKFKLATKYLSYKISFKNASLFQAIGISCALLTPGRLGELIKSFLLNKRLKIPITPSLGIVIVERIFDLIFLITAAIIYSILIVKNTTFNIIALTLFIIIIIILFLLKKSHIFKKIIPHKFKKYFDKPLKFNRSKKVLASLIIITILTWLADSLVIFFLSKAVNISLPFWMIIGITSISTIAALLSILPWGLGAYDLSILVLFTALGVSKEPATAILIASRLIGIIIPLILSIILINITHFSFKTIKEYNLEKVDSQKI